jgi:hypothetical protein
MPILGDIPIESVATENMGRGDGGCPQTNGFKPLPRNKEHLCSRQEPDRPSDRVKYLDKRSSREKIIRRFVSISEAKS